MQHVTLNNGVRMPILGFGVYQIPTDRTEQALMREHGVRHQAWGGFAEGRNDLFAHPVLAGIGDAHGRSVAQVVLRWLIQRDIVTIPKSVDPGRMAQNIDVFDFTLTDDQMAAITALDTGKTLFFDHRDPEVVTWLSKRRLDS